MIFKIMIIITEWIMIRPWQFLLFEEKRIRSVVVYSFPLPFVSPWRIFFGQEGNSWNLKEGNDFAARSKLLSVERKFFVWNDRKGNKFWLKKYNVATNQMTKIEFSGSFCDCNKTNYNIIWSVTGVESSSTTRTWREQPPRKPSFEWKRSSPSLTRLVNS